jgi:hypothetical protein
VIPARSWIPGVWAALGFLAVCAAPAAAGDAWKFEPTIELRGYLEEAIAVGFDNRDEIIMHRQTLSVIADGDLSDRLSYKVDMATWLDSAEFLDGVELNARVREAYVVYAADTFDLRVGRMQFAWGEADGFIVSDQLTPFDLTNFILTGFDSIRMGVDGVSFEYWFDNGDDLQLIYISHFQAPDFPERDSPWAFLDVDELEDRGLTYIGRKQPDFTFKNSEYGARYSGHPIWADWAVGWLHSFDDRPVARIRNGTVQLTHDEFELFTINLSAPVGDYLVRFDSAYEMGRFLSTAPTTAMPSPASLATAGSGFVRRHDVWRSLVGLDMKPSFWWWKQADASIQYLHEQVVDPHPALAERSEADLFSVLLRAGYRNDTIKPWIFAIWNARGADFWLQLRVEWDPADDWQVTLESDIFKGHEYRDSTNNGGIYGSFADNDLVRFVVRRSF